MLSEAIFVVVLSSAINGALCYGLYSKIQTDLDCIRGLLAPTAPQESEMIELSVNEQEANPPSPLKDGHDALIATDFKEAMNEAVNSVIAGGEDFRGEEPYNALLNASVEADSTIERDGSPPLVVGEHVEDGGAICEVGPSNSYLNLGAWLWKKDKSMSNSKNLKEEQDSNPTSFSKPIGT